MTKENNPCFSFRLQLYLSWAIRTKMCSIFSRCTPENLTGSTLFLSLMKGAILSRTPINTQVSQIESSICGGQSGTSLDQVYIPRRRGEDVNLVQNCIFQTVTIEYCKRSAEPFYSKLKIGEEDLNLVWLGGGY